MHYLTQSKTGKGIYSLSPLWGKLRVSYAYNAGIDKNRIGRGPSIVLKEKSFEKAKHRFRDDKNVHRAETRYPRLDRLIEEHF